MTELYRNYCIVKTLCTNSYMFVGGGEFACRIEQMLYNLRQPQEVFPKLSTADDSAELRGVLQEARTISIEHFLAGEGPHFGAGRRSPFLRTGESG